MLVHVGLTSKKSSTCSVVLTIPVLSAARNFPRVKEQNQLTENPLCNNGVIGSQCILCTQMLLHKPGDYTLLFYKELVITPYCIHNILGAIHEPQHKSVVFSVRCMSFPDIFVICNT